MPMIRVINRRAAGHVLPPAGSFEGRTLLPDGNNVESEYLDALRAQMDADVLALDIDGSPRLDKNDQPIVIKRRAGSFDRMLALNPHLEILTPEESVKEVKKPQGPPAPASLRDRPEEVAVAFIQIESDVRVLERWAKSDDRLPVKTAVKDRLQALKEARKGP